MAKKIFQILAFVGLSLAFQSKNAECRGWLGPDLNLQHIPAYMGCWSRCKDTWISCLMSSGYEVPPHDNSYNLPKDYTPQELSVNHCYSQRGECNSDCSDSYSN